MLLLIPLLPFLGFLINATIGRRWSKGLTGDIATAAMAGAFGVAATAVWTMLGLEPIGGRGISELRAVFGGLFIALSLTPLWLGTIPAFLMLGVGYLAIAAVRAVSIVVDRSAIPSNLISLATEIILGVVLVL